MAVARTLSVAFLGLNSISVEVEVDAVSSEFSSLVIVGLPDTAVRESKDRVLAALRNAGFRDEHWRFTVNLAPGHLRKEGALYDLPIALGMLQATGRLSLPFDLSHYFIIGELGLSGELRPIRGALPATLLARDAKKRGIILPIQNAEEAALVPDFPVYGVSSLQEALRFLQKPLSTPPILRGTSEEKPSRFPVDFADIDGQEVAKRALEIAAAGGHNVLLVGPPGVGKTMLAKAMPSIMPPLAFEEILEVTKIHSISGMLSPNEGLMASPPFRAPHHTVSYAGLMGGGSLPRPGEVSLAHHGVLFLDELPEFSRSLLETLRQPLEDRVVTISRARGHLTFPADFILVAAMNPCPCGMWGHPERPCRDSELQRERYRNKISQPLLDRIDMHITLSPVRYSEREHRSEGSETVQERVKGARQRQKERYGDGITNGRVEGKRVRQEGLDAASHEALRYAMDELHCTARSIDRLLRVARTIADLGGAAQITSEHLLEAFQYRAVEISMDFQRR